jgi:hypothetical protein
VSRAFADGRCGRETGFKNIRHLSPVLNWLPSDKFSIVVIDGDDMSTSGIEPLLYPKDAAKILNVSTSWLAKARLSGDGPRYTKIGRAVRYTEASLRDFIKSKSRGSTSEDQQNTAHPRNKSSSRDQKPKKKSGPPIEEQGTSAH